MKPITLVAIAAIIASASFGIFRHQRLQAIQGEIAGRGAASTFSSSGQETTAPATSISQRREAQAETAPTSAGLESLPEARICLAKVIERRLSGRGLRPDLQGFAELGRLKELLAAMGANTAQKLFSGISIPGDPDGTLAGQLKKSFEDMYVKMNPAQGLMLMLENPPGLDRDRSAAGAFSVWATADPTAALRWHREALAAGNPVAALPTVQERAAMAAGRVDPSRSIAIMINLVRESPGEITPAHLGFIAQQPNNANERIAFLKALDTAAEKPSDREILSAMRPSAIREITQILLKESFTEASSVVDAGFTPEERRYFAVDRGHSEMTTAADCAKWSQWMIGIEFPAGEQNPVVNLAATASFSKAVPGEPDWIDALPDGEVRQRAIAAYVFQEKNRDVNIARKWLEKMTDGPAKEDMRSRL